MARTLKRVVNVVYLDDQGVIHSVYHGFQSGKLMRKTLERIMKIMTILLRDNKPIRLLVDIRDMGQYDTMARLVDMHARTVLPFWKMAFVTSPDHLPSENISRKLTLMSGRRKEIRYFQHEGDAVGWLRTDVRERSN